MVRAADENCSKGDGSLDLETLRDSKPLWMGRRLVILAEGGESPDEQDRIPIRIESGGVFGTGEHATTRLCLAAIERHAPAGGKIIDIGTGTGILAMAAVKMGAGEGLAVDIDPMAVDIASRNIRMNGLENRIRVRQGSLETVLQETSEKGPAAMVIANILLNVIEGMFSGGLTAAVQPEGVLVLSGILSAQTPAIRTYLQINGFELAAQEQDGNWVCIMAKARKSNNDCTR